MDWRFVWIFALTVLTVIAAQPLGMGEMGDLYGGQTMGANHVPRLGRRSLSPLFKNNGFRFFGRAPSRNRAGFLGPLFSDRYQNFRFYGGRPGEELARGLLRDKKKDLQQPNVQIMPELEKSGAEETQVEPRQEDQEYWKNVLSEATINSVLEKMAEIGETREMIEEFNKYEKYGVGNPLPRYLARYNHPAPAMSQKVSVESSYPSAKDGMLSKLHNFIPFPR